MAEMRANNQSIGRLFPSYPHKGVENLWIRWSFPGREKLSTKTDPPFTPDSHLFSTELPEWFQGFKGVFHISTGPTTTTIFFIKERY
jgi:hypothetical protein